MGRRFVFELESVLKQRRRAERTRQQHVAGIETQRLALEERLRQIQRRMAEGKRELRDVLAGRPREEATCASVPIDSVRLAANASLHAVVLLQRGAIELAGVHQRLSAARRVLLQAAVARKAVETLRARRYAEWRRTEQRRETNELDDLVVMRAGRAGDRP